MQERQKISVSAEVIALIRKLLEQAVRSQSDDWLEECFQLMDRAGGNSEGRKWNREDLYNNSW